MGEAGKGQAQMIIETQNLHKRFGRHGALNGLDLSVPEGSAYALIGSNGAGKTTTIKLLVNIITPTEGRAMILGADSRAMSPTLLAQIGYVSENQELPGYMTVRAYLDYLRPLYPNWDRDLEWQVVHDLHLPPDRKIADLSHGMRMKMALACALPFRPKLLILDEPFSGLDPLARDEFIEGVLRHAGEMTILISSHELSEVESFATHVGFVEDGRMLFQESLEALQARLRSVRLVLEHEAAVPATPPETWLDITASGNVLSFVDTHYAEEGAQARLAALVPGVRRIDVEPVPLRAMFKSMARARRNRRSA
jgi:ABC-2 type transport system ATP-binding protein